MSAKVQEAMSGRSIGRYQVHSLLGTGAMGVVYRALDPQLDRIVAVKTIHIPENLNPYQRDKRTQSLLNEARFAARLNHPGIVKVYDAGEDDGEPYIVLECVEGQTLADTLAQRGALPHEEAFPLLQQLLEAVAAAHDSGLVHRDLKPANIMIQPEGQLRIMDFGIAQLADDPRQRAETIAGTPCYMSPEQFAGQRADMRSDVFALGVIFYEVLSGRRPFLEPDFDSLARAVRVIPHAPLQTHVTGLPPGIYALVNRALSKRPEDRYADARPMLDALKATRVDHEASAPAGTESSRKEIIDFILARITRQGDFPTTMAYISNITQTARKQTSSATSIAEAILKDFALTNRILRMVNSPYYNATRRSISTISRAVVILGIDSVLDVAAGLSVFEHFHNRCDIPKLKAQTVRALMTAFHAREIATQIGYPNAEEAFICGMMNHLGRLVVAFYFPDEYAAIELLLRQGVDEPAASHKVMRITYAELGEAIAQQWRLPESVHKCCRGLSPDHQGPLRTPDQMLQGIVSMAGELSKATMITDEDRRQLAQAAVARQFEGMIRLTPRQLGAITEKSIRNAWDISHGLRVNLRDLGVADTLLATSDANPVRPAGTHGETPLHELTPGQSMADPLEDSIYPDEDDSAAFRHDFLIKTMGEITTMLSGTYQLNDMLMMIMEGMYRGVGSQHVILALVNPSRTLLTYRFGLGPNTDEIRQIFNIQLTAEAGLPAQCILDAREVFVADISAGRRGALPPDIQALLRAKSLLLLPIIVREQPIGLFLLDRGPDQPVFDKHDLLNLRTLANQAVLAIKQCQTRR